MTDVRPDAKRSLAQLRDQWEGCRACALGEMREAVGGAFVFGRGNARSIMFVGEGPGAEEEKTGQPFVGRSGQLFMKVLERVGIDNYYMTNLVSCRSCSPQVDAQGLPITRTNWKTKAVEQVFKDEPPLPAQCAACLPRLYEEIYLVDPFLIVGLGNKACEVLMKRSVTITMERGEATQIAIPGHGFHPVFTDKKHEWIRKLRKEIIQPVEQNEVLYHFMPTLHPAHVARNLQDARPGGAFQSFARDLRQALRTYEAYLELAFGRVPRARDSADADEQLQYEVQQEE